MLLMGPVRRVTSNLGARNQSLLGQGSDPAGGLEGMLKVLGAQPTWGVDSIRSKMDRHSDDRLFTMYDIE
jgi:hypothetical protein